MQKLVLHPSAHASAANQLKVVASAKIQSRGVLLLEFRVTSPAGAPKVVGFPQKFTSSAKLENSARKDELWKTTCFEAFVMRLDGSYNELNLSPSGEWNLYSFDSYRNGMKREERITSLSDFRVHHSVSNQIETYEVSVALAVQSIMQTPQNFRLGLTAVIETVGGERSYWSLKHSSEKPDFHDSRGHILELSTRT